jgi:membrane protease subunit HflC
MSEKTANTLLLRGAFALVLLTVLGGAMFLYQVDEREHVIVTRFGNPVRQPDEPGLHFRLPWPVETVVRMDKRMQVQTIRLSEALTRDRRNVLLPVFAVWRIEDPLLFLQSVGNEDNARRRLDTVLTSVRNDLLTQHDFSALVSTEPSLVRISEIEAGMLESVSAIAASSFGIRVERVGISQVSLPEANTTAVFDRMRAERAQFAARFRAEGQQQADVLRAEAEAERTLLLAEARRFAEVRRGEAEAEAARLFASARNLNPELFTFLRELQTLGRIAPENTTLILDFDSPPFRLLRPESAKDEKP